jgi:polyamine oxidase
MKFTFPRKQLLSTAIWPLPLLFTNNALAAYAQCRKTEVVILGAGVAGIIAAQTLQNNSIDNFIIVEYNPEIGGRMRNTQFGDKNYTVEFGANWVEGLGSRNGPQNPIWQMVQKHEMQYTNSNFNSLTTYDENGINDYTSIIDDYKRAYKIFEQDAGIMLTENLEDRSARAGLSLGGWKPGQNKTMQAVEWWQWGLFVPSWLK